MIICFSILGFRLLVRFWSEPKTAVDLNPPISTLLSELEVTLTHFSILAAVVHALRNMEQDPRFSPIDDASTWRISNFVAPWNSFVERVAEREAILDETNVTTMWSDSATFVAMAAYV